ncbi:PREDICTED: uncharacterized protein LOC106744331, partial [Dinoponera quadriceps]|uniref:Uncharacterized protein LOC106744331 n=1 Tax=Dinoponera quadriceps TaxID=609295 RepID=A0A6P3X7W1_DINQU
MRAGCHIELPREIQTKKAVINVKFGDNACFAWAVVAALYPVDRDANRASMYPHYTTVLNLQNIEFPMSVNKITNFERQNNISINVYSAEKKKTEKGKTTHVILPIRLTDRTMDRHVNLLYLPDPRDDNVRHFVWIKNLSRLVSSQLSKHDHKKYICNRCLHYFSSSERLQVHTIDCGEMNHCAILLPSEDDKWLSFCNHNRKKRPPFVVYADLECILRKTTSEEGEDHKSLAYRHHT